MSKIEKKRAARIAASLEKHYGKPRPMSRDREDPLYVLVLTILSQNTNDVNRDRAMERLQIRFPEWKDLARANRRSIESAIRVGGLANQKSARIKEVMKWTKATFGDYSLDKMSEMSTEKAYETLTALKGVGPKTASIVLLFGFDRPLFPVDTHIHRVSTRLGFLKPGTTAAEAHTVLGNIFDPKNYYSIHINIINHGRALCSARKPSCAKCFLADECPWPESNPEKRN